MHHRSVCLLAVASLLLWLPQLTACQMSRSSSRIFASLASAWSLSKSFQSSFGRDRDASFHDDYAREVAAVGAAFVASGEPEAVLRHDVTFVAEHHGITDWEGMDETWLGLTAGLRHAGMSEVGAEALVARVFGPDRLAETRAVEEAP